MIELNFENLSIPIPSKEEIHSNMSQMDVQDTNNEFFKIEMELHDMLKGMTLEQRHKINDIVKKFIDEE